jgi:hypothetical protein
LRAWDAKQTARINGIGRAVLGASIVLAPTIAGRQWVGSDGHGPATKVFGRALGVRDVALGAGLVWALEKGEPTQAWIAGRPWPTQWTPRRRC